ncbi:hypothetical protein G7054_g2503 [Neopestalotiopsis clavispora]|nr:hypothetical protein G7054_g2503 [Neopestalotiopsis clavispora]
MLRRRLLSTMATAGQKRFAPLREGVSHSNDLPKLRGVVFDVDGTLCEPQNHMFIEMREVLGIPKSIDILDHIYSLSPESAQEAAMEKIRAIERRNMEDQVAQPGLKDLMTYLDSRSIPKGICTRNFDGPVTHLLTKFLPGSPFQPIITPGPGRGGAAGEELKGLVQESDESAGVKAGALDTGSGNGNEGEIGDASGLIMVGDSIDDMTAGRRAGAATVLLINPANEHLAEHSHTDLIIERLDDLVQVLEEGFIGREDL